jgi:hypothetical protein
MRIDRELPELFSFIPNLMLEALVLDKVFSEPAKKERPPRGGPSSCNSGIGQSKTAIGPLLRRKPA